MTSFELLRLELGRPDDIPSLRHLCGRAAELLGCDTTDRTRVATSASELGRFAQAWFPVQAQLSVDRDRHVLDITVRAATGPMTLDAATDQGVRVAIARLMDEIVVDERGVTIRKALPHAVSEAGLAIVRDTLVTERPGDLTAMLQTQNQELITALSLLRERESELVRVNAELDETNRGVIALYAELEARTDAVRQAQRAVFEELERALRPAPPAMAGFELDVRYLPAQVNSPTGGDLYDWFVLPDGNLHITVVDVRGHGVTGTRDALQVTHAVRTLSLEGQVLGQLLARVDNLQRSLGASLVATALLARADPRTGVVRLAGAGHPEALHIRRYGSPQYVRAPGRPVGYLDAGSRTVATVQLSVGDTLLLYTDGLIEIRRDVLEGLDTLQRAAEMAAPLPLPQLLDTTLAACAQGEPLNDDTLLLALRWTPGA